jgi:hypothetical protein
LRAALILAASEAWLADGEYLWRLTVPTGSGSSIDSLKLKEKNGMNTEATEKQRTERTQRRNGEYPGGLRLA